MFALGSMSLHSFLSGFVGTWSKWRHEIRWIGCGTVGQLQMLACMYYRQRIPGALHESFMRRLNGGAPVHGRRRSEECVCVCVCVCVSLCCTATIVFKHCSFNTSKIFVSFKS